MWGEFGGGGGELSTVLLPISCELMLVKVMLWCVYSYGMKSESRRHYNVCTLLFGGCKIVKLNCCDLGAYLGTLVQCLCA